MISGIKQRGVVGRGGTTEIQAPELPEGTVVEIIVLVEQPSDKTEYLLSTEANRQQLRDALEQAEDPNNLVVITPEEWDEKYRI